MKDNKIAVSEHFLSIQGEGRTQGKPSYFLRLAGCNLMCGGHGTEKDGELHDGATWRCDSIEVWLKGKKKSFSEIIEMMGGPEFIADLASGVHLIITGGEPLLWQSQIVEFLKFIIENHSVNPFVEIETNGTIMPDTMLLSLVSLFNVSPKLKNSGMKESDRIKKSVLKRFNMTRGNHSIFKFVISSDEDFKEVNDLVSDEEFISWSRVWLMPAADNREDLQEASIHLAKLCIKHRINFSNRLHIQIWDKKTGV